MENYDGYIQNIFQSIHGAVTRETYIPITEVGTPEQLEVLTRFKIPHEHVYHNPKGFMDQYVYWNGPVYLSLHGITPEVLEMFQVDKKISVMEDHMRKKIAANEWHTVFMLVDKKARITVFKEMFDQIPDTHKYNVFVDIYTGNEFGFELFDDELLKKVFSVKGLDAEHNERMQQFAEDAKANTNPDGTITVYHGKAGEYNVNDELSWTLSTKTAKFFANRFKSKGKVVSKKIRIEQVADYFTNRNESEVIILPKRLLR